MSQCCVLCTLARPACSRSAVEPVASVNVRVVAEQFRLEGNLVSAIILYDYFTCLPFYFFCFPAHSTDMSARSHGQEGALAPPGDVVKCFVH